MPSCKVGNRIDKDLKVHWGDHLRDLEKLRDSTHTSHQPRQGYARGGSVKNKMKKLASEGRGGDTKLAKIGPRTAKMLDDAVHHGRVQRNPKTGLREYMLSSGRETRAQKRKLVQTPYDPALALPPNYYNNIPKQKSPSCVLHATDNVLREIGQRSGVPRGRRNSGAIEEQINRVPPPRARGRRNIVAANLQHGNEVSHILDRIGIPYQRIANPARDLPDIIQDILPPPPAGQPPAGHPHSVIFEGIPYLHPNSKEYEKKQKQNIRKKNTDNSHAINITRMNLYDPVQQATTGRRGSLSFLDSNNPGLQRGLIGPSPEYPVYPMLNPHAPDFNLQNDRSNVIYDIDAAQASQDLQNRGIYPFA